MQQDFFDFDEFEVPQHPVKKKRRRGRLFIFLGILVAVLAGLGTVLGIFRSNDTYLAKDLRQTFSIQPPPAPELPSPKPSEPARPASGGTPVPASTLPTAPAGHAQNTQDRAPTGGRSPEPVGHSPARKVQAQRKPTAAKPPHLKSREAAGQHRPSPVAKMPPATAVRKAQPVAATTVGVSAGAETRGLKTPAATPQSVEAARNNPRKKPSGKAGWLQLQPADLVERGALTAAAGRYRRFLLKHPARYSISLEVACQRETVMRAFEHAGPGHEMFVLPKKIGGKSCFAVLWGRYASIAAAKQEKAAVPSFFRSQSSQPRIVALHPMLQ